MYNQYDKAVQTVLEYQSEQGFSRTVGKEFRRATREFKAYLEEGNLEYSHRLAQAWLSSLKPGIPRRKFLSFRRSLALVDVAARNGILINVQFFYDDAPVKYRVPNCYRHLLARYILEGRPVCDVPNVFVTLKRPYRELSASCCYRSTLVILGRKKSAVDVRGLHIARRTFASHLLAAGNPVSMISSTLGHKNESTVDEYLATDGHRMRQCAIRLVGIELTGALR